MRAHVCAGGHEVLVSGSRGPVVYDTAGGGDRRRTSARAAEAVAFGEVFVFAVPWRLIDEIVPTLGPLRRQDRHRHDEPVRAPAGSRTSTAGTAAQVNAQRLAGARYTKSFNTLTAAFQAEASLRKGDDRVALFLCGDDDEAKKVVAGLIADAGFVPVDLGGTADAAPMEASRREGSVYGEEYREPEARAAAEALRAGRPLPPTPQY